MHSAIKKKGLDDDITIVVVGEAGRDIPLPVFTFPHLHRPPRVLK